MSQNDTAHELKPRAERKELAEMGNTLNLYTKTFFDFVKDREDRADEESTKKFLTLKRMWINFCHRKWRFNTPKINAFEDDIKRQLKAMKQYEDTIQKQNEDSKEREPGPAEQNNG